MSTSKNPEVHLQTTVYESKDKWMTLGTYDSEGDGLFVTVGIAIGDDRKALTLPYEDFMMAADMIRSHHVETLMREVRKGKT